MLILVLRSCNCILSCLRNATGGWIFRSLPVEIIISFFNNFQITTTTTTAAMMMRWCDALDDTIDGDALDETMWWWCDAINGDSMRWYESMMVGCDKIDDGVIERWRYYDGAMMMIRSNDDGATMTIRSMILRTMTMVLLVMRWCDAFNNAIGNAMVRLILQ